uniref:G_PROTEIN_RECEP_F1_2 domain-containing protein n=1 Tax=Macrostomum lignano TaxID=282301 RepID=A0A1I8GRT0_9PLAT
MAPNQQFSIAASLANGTGLGCSRTCIAVRAVTIPVAAAGLLLSCLWLLILIGKYRRNPEPVDIGLILMQLAFTNFCLAALCYVAFELALLKSGHTRWASFKHNVSFANLWMMCTCLFRFMAISRPMKFRRWLTCRIQLCSFAVLLLVASAVVFGAFAGWRLTAGGSEQFLVNTMLPLTRTTQTYLPVPLIVLISALTVAELAAARANRPGDNIASLSPSSTHSSGADANTNAIPATEDPVAAAAAAAAACENAALAAAECFNASVMSSEDEDGSSTKAMTDVTDAIEAARAAAAANQYSAKAAKAVRALPEPDCAAIAAKVYAFAADDATVATANYQAADTAGGVARNFNAMESRAAANSRLAGAAAAAAVAATAAAAANSNAVATAAATVQARNWCNTLLIVCLSAGTIAALELPGAVMVIVQQFRPLQDWLVPVDDLLVTCHGAVHFAIFGAFSANFRGQLRQLLRCQANRDAPKSGRDGQPRQQENRPLVGTKTRPS